MTWFKLTRIGGYCEALKNVTGNIALRLRLGNPVCSNRRSAASVLPAAVWQGYSASVASRSR
jgi:hypothetical protein